MHPLAVRVLQGDVRAVARLLRLVDDRSPGHQEALRDLYPRTGRARVLGITGNPGAGKSTLTDQLIARFRALGKRVGVIAVDPSSPFSGGAILGDRIRMQRHALDPEVFIRSLATRGHLGGVSRSTIDCVHVLDAWGADVVLLETVGVGQDELDVARIAHTTLVVMAPGLGDEVQAIKAGILEIADVFVVNKADRDGADATVRDLEGAIALGHEMFAAGIRAGGHHGAGRLRTDDMQALAGNDWIQPVLKVVATRGEGIDRLIEAVDRHGAFTRESDEGLRRRIERTRDEVGTMLRGVFAERVERVLAGQDEALWRDLLERRANPYEVVDRLRADC